MDDILIQKINEILKTRKNCTVNIINDKLTLSVFSMLRKNLKHVSKINFIIRDPRTLPVQEEVTREFELSVNNTLFNAYDIMEKNKLRHFEQARTMFDFIEKQVSVKRTTTACRIKGNVLLIDDVFMIQGTSSLEYSPKIRKSAASQAEYRAMYRERFQTRYNNKVIFSHEDREFITAKMHRFNLFKRLDSSVFAFGETIRKQTFLTDLAFDKTVLDDIYSQVQAILQENRDNKLATLGHVVQQKIGHTPYNSGNRKVLIFTAFSDTARYLYDALSQAMKKNNLVTAMITGSDKPRVNSRRIEPGFDTVLCAFSPRSKIKTPLSADGQVDILIGTGCISEGQNTFRIAIA